MKAHQRTIREQAPPEPDEDVKRELARSFEHATVREVDYQTAKPHILRYEWLGTMGASRWFFALYFGEHIAGIAAFGATAGTRTTESVAGVENANRVCTLVRGCCLPWAHPHSASWFIPRASRLMAERYGKNIVVAYSDERAGEVGTVYQATNWIYAGRSNPSQQFRTPNGRVHDGRQVSGLARDRRGGTLRYHRTRSAQKMLLIEQGAEFQSGYPKHRYVHIAGSPRTVKRLRRALKWPSLPYPKRTPERA